jgi:hypothetical protein
MSLFNNTQVKYEIFKHVPEDNEVNDSINYVVYSHSSFIDMLQIQTDHIENKGHLTLFIDRNNNDLDFIYKRYDKVVFYDPNLPYGTKLLDCVNQIDYDYFVLIHDIDILIHVDTKTVLEFISFLRKNNFDRVDFQLAYDYDESHKVNDDDLYLIKSSNTDTSNKGYAYNVNPSIWKRDALVEILSRFKDRDYREIESDEVQQFCSKFEIFKLYSRKRFRCGYFTCLSPFRYLHLTHSRMIFSPRHIPEEDSVDIIIDYNRIVDKYNLKNSDKWIT